VPTFAKESSTKSRIKPANPKYICEIEKKEDKDFISFLGIDLVGTL
jgi:hypothetical protein